MNFGDLTSEKTILDALNWVAMNLQSALEEGRDRVKFTFSPNGDNKLEDIFEFASRLKDMIYKNGFNAWVVLDNVNEQVNIIIIMKKNG